MGRWMERNGKKMESWRGVPRWENGLHPWAEYCSMGKRQMEQVAAMERSKTP